MTPMAVLWNFFVIAATWSGDTGIFFGVARSCLPEEVVLERQNPLKWADAGLINPELH